jgi:hypothetical protein
MEGNEEKSAPRIVKSATALRGWPFPRPFLQAATPPVLTTLLQLGLMHDDVPCLALFNTSESFPDTVGPKAS